ncbi:MAG TPA: ComEA family DNA-binding protein [Micromonosporaceae bacterium]
MSDDETLVRQRLLALLDADPAGGGHVSATEHVVRPAAGVPGPPADGVRPTAAVDPVGRSALTLDQPPNPVGPSAPDQPVQPSAPFRWLGDSRVFDPGRRGVKALAVVAAAVVLGAGAWAWRSRPQTQPLRDVPSAGQIVEPVGDPAIDPSAATPAGEVVVAVSGKVRRPGLVRLPAGARVADAIEGAGGTLPGAETSLLNLARKVTDGELILVGVTPPPGTVTGATGETVAGGGKVNLNTATQAQLETLPGVGPVLAQRILAYRERHGGFRSVTDLRRVEGIGDARFEQLRDLVTV